MAKKFSLEKKIEQFRKLCFGGVKKAIASGRQCRSYECRVAVFFPSYIDEVRKSARYSLQLSCSLLGRGNHHAWSGTDWQSVFELAEEDVKHWVKQVEYDLGETDEEP